MELDMRKMRILAAIIDDYILTAAPVGSRTVSQHPDIPLSSATIRNEMSGLEELGFLEQPHTSAGRIPSDKAYRLYVNTIMSQSKLSDDETHYIRSHLTQTIDEVEQVVQQTAWVLSNMTKYTSMVLTPQLNAVRLRRVQLVPVGEGKALAVIVTDAGIARDSIVRVPRNIGDEQLERLSQILTRRLANRKLDEITGDLIPEISAGFVEQKVFLEATLDAVRKSVAPGTQSVTLSGANNMLNYPEYSDVDKVRAFLSAIETKDTLYKLLTEATKVEFSITIGRENESLDMQDCSVVTATYRVGEEPIGSLGVIGPTRMNYSRILAILSYMGRSLSDVLTNIFEEER